MPRQVAMSLLESRKHSKAVEHLELAAGEGASCSNVIPCVTCSARLGHASEQQRVGSYSVGLPFLYATPEYADMTLLY